MTYIALLLRYQQTDRHTRHRTVTPLDATSAALTDVRDVIIVAVQYNVQTTDYGLCATYIRRRYHQASDHGDPCSACSATQGRIQDWEGSQSGSLGVPIEVQGKAPVGGLWDKSPRSW